MNHNDIKLNSRFKILTPSGYQDFSGIRKLKKDCYYTISLSNGKIIKCSDNHPFIFNLNEIRAGDIKIGSKITGENGLDVEVVSIIKHNESIDLYDILNVDNGNIFNVDGIVSHNCNFATSGNQVINMELLEFYKQTYIKDPIEKRGLNQDLWIWDYPDYTKNYMISADCARGDGADYSAFHVVDVDRLEQVAEFKGKLSPKDFGNLLVTTATEFNNALLVVENNSYGVAVLQQIIDRNYANTFYSSTDLSIVDVERTYSNRINSLDKRAIPGFTTTQKNRVYIVSKIESIFREKLITIKSIRLYEELKVFIWNGSKAEAMSGMNDDLVMSLGIGLWVRDTAVRLKNEQMLCSKTAISRISKVSTPVITQREYSSVPDHLKTMEFSVNGQKESLKWLL